MSRSPRIYHIAARIYHHVMMMRKLVVQVVRCRLFRKEFIMNKPRTIRDLQQKNHFRGRNFDELAIDTFDYS